MSLIAPTNEKLAAERGIQPEKPLGSQQPVIAGCCERQAS
jgi:hypothetical protein